MRISHRQCTRSGFTLVEVLVAAGLSMLIMVMVTTAFSKGMDSLSQLKSVGEMQQKLRSFELVMRGDLEADHFESRYGPKVSDQLPNMLLSATLTNETAPWRPPSRGFFRLVTPNCTWEGTDTVSGGNPSTRATDHILHMTVKRNATRGDKLFAAKMPVMTPVSLNAMSSNSLSQMDPNVQSVASDWAEVVYFLHTVNHTNTTGEVGRTPGGTPLYGLYRRVRVLAGSGTPSSMSVFPHTSNYDITPITSLTATDRDLGQAVSHAPANVDPARILNDPQQIRNPRNRLGGILSDRRSTSGGGSMTSSWDTITREESNNVPTGSDLLLADVISFEIKADWDSPSNTIPLPKDVNAVVAGGDGVDRYEFPFNTLPKVGWNAQTGVQSNRNSALNGVRVFDTWYDLPNDNWLKPVTGTGTNEDVIPQPIRLRAVQIKVRVWDRKNKLARQVTIVQDL